MSILHLGTAYQPLSLLSGQNLTDLLIWLGGACILRTAWTKYFDQLFTQEKHEYISKMCSVTAPWHLEPAAHCHLATFVL